MSSEFGNKLRMSVFGESHGEAVGVTVNGLPAGEYVDFDELQAFLDRRKPGSSSFVSARKECDIPKFLSGIKEGRLEGSPLAAVFSNSDAHSSDYTGFADTPRPSHADYTAGMKYRGFADMRGGGHFSGRLTAPIALAGGIARQILARRGIYVGAHLASVGGINDASFPLCPDKALFDALHEKAFPTVDDSAGEAMRREVERAMNDKDSVGGRVECAIVGVPAGLGSPIFDGIESRLASALFAIPGAKAVAFGNGFDCASLRGSENNDEFVINDIIATSTNRSGGVQGGISNGMPVCFTVAMKPTPSIGLPQKTVNLRSRESATIELKGRHDPCIAVRALPVVEAVAAFATLDLLLEESMLPPQKKNIVLIGMPGAGKSVIGRALAGLTGKKLIDIDEEIERAAGMSIAEIFRREGEEGFRIRERSFTSRAGYESGSIIVTGGGVVKDRANLVPLRGNGLVFHIVRDISLLAREGRPLSENADIEAMERERRPLYESFRDFAVQNDRTPEDAARDICALYTGGGEQKR